MKLNDDTPAWVEKARSEPFTKDDILFRSVDAGTAGDGDSETNAWLRGGTPYAYAEGYRRAARLVADSVIQEGWDTHFLVYPIAFLYRHNIELQLKMLIQDGAFLTRRTLSKEDWNLIMKSHLLDQLWAKLELILRKLAKDGFGIRTADIDAAGSYIRQIHEIDEKSFSFRYMTDKDGVRSIDTEKLSYLNIRDLAGGMEKLTGFLFGLGESFHQAAQGQFEMEADAYAEERRCTESYGEY